MANLTINGQTVDAVFNGKGKGYTYTYNGKTYTDAAKLRAAMGIKDGDSVTAGVNGTDKSMTYTAGGGKSNTGTTTSNTKSNTSSLDLDSANPYKNVDTSTSKSGVGKTDYTTGDVSNFQSDPSKSLDVNVENTNKDFVKDSINSWDQKDWDYQADVSAPENKDRLNQMKNNLKNEATQNPEAYEVSKEQFLKNHNADKRDPSQIKVLEDAWENYSKYELTSDENAVADAASQVAKDEANERINASIDNMNKKQANLKQYVDTMIPEYQSYIDRYEDVLADYLDDIAELKAMQKEYYNVKKKSLMDQAAGNMAGMASRLSAAGLSYGAVAGAQNQAKVVWDKQYTELRDQHLNKLQELSKLGADMYTNILNSEKGITDEKKNLLNDYFTSVNKMLDDVEEETKTGISNYYNPYKKITDSKVTGVSETAQAGAKKEDVAAQYQSAPAGSEKRKNYIKDYFKTYLGESAELKDYIDYLDGASRYDNISDAMKYLKDKKAGESKKTGGEKIIQDKDSNENPEPEDVGYTDLDGNPVTINLG